MATARKSSFSASRAFPVAPVPIRILSKASSNCTPSAVIPAPAAASGTVTYLVMLPPTSFIFSPAACIFSPRVLDASDVFFNCFSKPASSCSAFTTSRWKARYCSSLISPLRNCSLTCSWAVFSRSSFSLLFSTASARSFCF